MKSYCVAVFLNPGLVLCVCGVCVSEICVQSGKYSDLKTALDSWTIWVDYAAVNLQFQACPLISGWFYIGSFLSTITKLQKATIISSCLSLHRSTCNEQLDSHWMVLHVIQYSSIYWQSCQETSGFIKYDKNNGTLCEEICLFMIVSNLIHVNTTPKHYTFVYYYFVWSVSVIHLTSMR